eukprot:4017408-Heterocapsa_arctica.AAC.1
MSRGSCLEANSSAQCGLTDSTATRVALQLPGSKLKRAVLHDGLPCDSGRAAAPWKQTQAPCAA